MILRRVALVGLRGSGKTTVAACLAERWGCAWEDLDHTLAQAQCATSASELLQRTGEARFRALEWAHVQAQAQLSTASIWATGGGLVVQPLARAWLARNALVVWLDAPVDVLVQRLQRDPHQRPALTALTVPEEVRWLYQQREHAYRSCAHLILDAARSPEIVAQELVQRLAAYTSA